jgi:Membrane bound O-acyl transferase family
VNGYSPTSPTVLVLLGALLASSLAAGLCLTRRPLPGGRLAAWLFLAVSVVLAERWTRSEPGGLRMLGICAALFFGFKSVVGTQALAAGAPALTFSRWFGFTLAWPGMNPDLFSSTQTRLEGGTALLRRGAWELASGAILVGLARWVWVSTHYLALATAPLLVGLSLIGHFGLFGIAAGFWRDRGVPCVAPFQAPLYATSLAEFWSRRWNRPFSELIQRTIYRPAAAFAGKPAAVGAGFLLSGILHELAISVPARAGYGRPLAYFALQGALVIGEKGLVASGYDPRHRLATLLAFTLPLPLLLIPQFLRTAIWPIIGVR